MIWNYTDKAILTMKNFSENELKTYLSKISEEALYAYNVYQIEGPLWCFCPLLYLKIIFLMGLPIKKIKEYLKEVK
jgi:septum formation protein